jgi:hypothetical protein
MKRRFEGASVSLKKLLDAAAGDRFQRPLLSERVDWNSITARPHRQVRRIVQFNR